MKTIILENGQIIEKLTLKEALTMIYDCYINNKDFLTDDFSLYIKYKNGTEYYISATDEIGKFKKTGIETVIENNPCTYQVYGLYQLVKVDESEDDENCTWLVI